MLPENKIEKTTEDSGLKTEPTVVDSTPQEESNFEIDQKSSIEALQAVQRESQKYATEANTLRKELTKVKGLLKKFEGVDPQKVEALQREAAEQAKAKQESLEEAQVLLTEKDAVIAQLTEKTASLEKRSQELYVEGALKAAFVRAGGKEGDWIDIVLNKAKQRVKINEEGTLCIIDAKTGMLALGKAGKLKTVDDLMVEFATGPNEVLKSAFEAPNKASGSTIRGTIGNVGLATGHGINPDDLTKYSGLQIIELAMERKRRGIA